jgi:hypothetical protein
MNLQENIYRIKEVMGIINEQAQIETVSHTITQPYPNPNWDTVHGFSLKASDDDLEYNVGLKLKSGDYRVVDVRISTTINGNTIETKGDVDVEMVKPNEVPHKYFTTRGAIGIPGVVNKSGQTYLDRYDINIKGIEGRLKAHYKSNIIKTFGPFHISIVGDNHKYKQIFYAIEQPPTNTSNATTPTTIKANSMNELRTKLQTETKNISIDPNTITFNSSDFSVSFNPGNTMIKSMSIIYDNEEQLDNRITNSLLPKNPTMVVAKKDTSNTALQWAIVYFT